MQNSLIILNAFVTPNIGLVIWIVITSLLLLLFVMFIRFIIRLKNKTK